jgi:glycerophosphoryl diester phosphodiesterase
MSVMNIIFCVVIFVLVSTGISLSRGIDIQAHRGGMALYPENTIIAMLNAMDWGVNTLEMDLSISQDKKVIVSHEQVMDHRYVTTPCGKSVTKAEEKNYKLYNMPYDSIVKYDTGIKGDPRFPQRKKVKAHKPLLSDLIDETEAYARKNNLPLPCYNIEIKSSVKIDNVYAPDYKEFTDLALGVLLQKNLADRLVIQSFDTRTLNYIHEQYPQIRLSYLVGKQMVSFEETMSELKFIPEIFSPDYVIVNKELVKAVHKKGMKILPWTVDSLQDIQRMIDLKVDGFITNYPDRGVKMVRFSKNYQQSDMKQK